MNKTGRYIYRLPLLWLSITCIFSLTAGPEPVIISFINEDLRTGDIVFRRGLSFASRVVLALDPSAEFSHVGIIALQGGKPVVIHTEPSTGAGEGGKAVVEKLEQFLSPQKACYYTIARVWPGLEEIACRAAVLAEKFAENETPFDSDFDLSTDNRLYCTELVWKSFALSGLDLVDGEFDVLRVPFNHRPVILPGSLVRSPHLFEVTSGWVTVGR